MSPTLIVLHGVLTGSLYTEANWSVCRQARATTVIYLGFLDLLSTPPPHRNYCSSVRCQTCPGFQVIKLILSYASRYGLLAGVGPNLSILNK